MANYDEIIKLMNNKPLLDKVCAAAWVTAYTYQSGAPTADQSKWAGAVLLDPVPEAKKALRAILVKNRASSVATIEALSDATVQTDLDAKIAASLVADYGVNG